MCGIWCGIGNSCDFYTNFLHIKHRGPDNSIFITHPRYSLGFHRLKINDLSDNGNQPFMYSTPDVTVYVLCNGEIYNHKELEEKYDIKCTSASDCEVIMHMYKLFGFTKMNELKGEFALIILEETKDNITVYACRDPFGIRPLYMNSHEIASEMKAIEHHDYDNVKIIPPTKYLYLQNNYYKFCDFFTLQRNMYTDDYSKVREVFTQSVIKRLQSDRPIGCLLSGGLDSSLVAAIAAQHVKLHTFSIGLEGSTDEYYAKLVADHIGSNHTHITVTKEELIDNVPVVIKLIETYDITTIRASVPQYTLCQKIADRTDIKVLLVGDGSDELTGGYKYFRNAPNAKEFDNECRRLLSEIYYFDVKRVDATISGCGLEARVPFLDIDFVNTYLSINPELRMSKNGLEKYLLRTCFEGLLPHEVLYRPKEAFSDGVSSTNDSWYLTLKNHFSNTAMQKYKRNNPPTPEAVYYRNFYSMRYPDIVPHYWMPRWVNENTEPSARVITYERTSERVSE